METRYVWEPDSFAAVLETDDTKLLFRIQTARASISDRIRELSLDGTAIFDPKVFVERPRTTTRLVIAARHLFFPDLIFKCVKMPRTERDKGRFNGPPAKRTRVIAKHRHKAPRFVHFDVFR
jgi:hypothetical protein